MQIVLASQSPYRKAQLTAFGAEFTAHAPRVNEAELKASGPTDPKELTRFLALKKAESLERDFPNALILGSDQIAAFAGERLDKPGSKMNAVAQLKRLSGQTHELITSLAVIHQGRRLIETEVTRLKMRNLDGATIESYLQLDEPLDCAGSYKVERAGLALIECVEGTDPSAIQGLPLISLTRCLLQLGLAPELLWRRNK